jgi:peptidyl-prolyl cis-trans isomerase C
MPRSVVALGVEIPERLILEEAQNHPGASAAEAHAAAAKALAIKALLLNRARELGLEPEPQPLGDGVEEAPEEALIRAVLDAEVEIRKPGEAECRRVYDANRARFSRDSVTLPFEDVRDRISAHLESRAWTAAAIRYVEGLAEVAQREGPSVSLDQTGQVAGPGASLGQLLSEEGLSLRFGPWLEAADPELHDRLTASAQAQGLSGAEFVQAAVGRFIAEATDESWTNLISAARDAEDPALACARALLKSSLQPKRRNITLISRA